jgi:hypothetical protein
MKVQDSKGFSVGVTLLKKRSGSINAILGGCTEYAYRQALDNGNSSPFMVLREILPTIAKPTGCSMKALDAFITDYTGFTWNKETKSYKKDAGANIRSLPGAEGQQHCRFWEFPTEASEKTERTWRHDIILAMRKAARQGAFLDEVLDEVVKSAEEAKLTTREDLAATLGLAA